MVRIIELMEDELVLPKPLSPGERSNINGNKDSDETTLYSLHDIHHKHKIYKDLEHKIDLKYNWTPNGSTKKTPEEIEATKKEYFDAKKAMSLQSLSFVNELEKALPFIEKNCSKYLPIIHNFGFLYRGFKKSDLSHSVFYGFPRNNRMTRDSSSILQGSFDKFLMHIGVKALRSNSLFCSGDKAVAEGYGLPFIIIPCNDASFAWSRNFIDIILDNMNAPDFEDYHLQLDMGKMSEREFAKKTQQLYQIRTVDLDDAIKRGHEIWVHGHYVAILATLENRLLELLFK